MEEKQLKLFGYTQDHGDGSSGTYVYMTKTYSDALVNVLDCDYVQEDNYTQSISYKGAINVDTICDTIDRDSEIITMTTEYIDFLRDQKALGITWSEADDLYRHKINIYRNGYIGRMYRHLTSTFDEQAPSLCGINSIIALHQMPADFKLTFMSLFQINLTTLQNIIDAYNSFQIDLYFELALDLVNEIEIKLFRKNYMYSFHDYMKMRFSSNVAIESSKIGDYFRKLNYECSHYLNLGITLATMYELNCRQEHQDLYNAYGT